MAYDKNKTDVSPDDERTFVNLIESHIDDSLGFIQTENISRATNSTRILHERTIW